MHCMIVLWGFPLLLPFGCKEEPLLRLFVLHLQQQAAFENHRMFCFVDSQCISRCRLTSIETALPREQLSLHVRLRHHLYFTAYSSPSIAVAVSFSGRSP